MAKFVSNRPVRVYNKMQLNADNSKGIGIFGGTFDPVHIGHLRASVELRKIFGLSEMRLIPSANPPHKAQPETSAEHRLAMLQLALANEPGLVSDERELHRKGLSYTLDTLTEIRAEIGVETPLCLCIGMDSLIDLNQWHRWRELTEVAHVVAVARPGWHLSQSGEVLEFVRAHRASGEEELLAQPAGNILIKEITLLPVSATGIRQALQRGESIRYLVPDSVIDYIRQHQLYSDKKDKPKQEIQ